MNNIVKYFSTIVDGNLALHIGDNDELVINNRKTLALKLNKCLQDFVFMNQIHGGKSMIVSKLEKGIGTDKVDENLSCDSLVTNKKGIVLSVLVADCLPILFFDEVNDIIGVVHGGWKGTISKVVENTVKNMLNIGANIEHIKVVIGPGISKESYEVGVDVGNYFRDEVKTKIVDGKQFVNLSKQNYLDLLDLGVKDYNIEVIDKDTFTDNNYYSARRDGFNKGRFGGFIYIK